MKKIASWVWDNFPSVFLFAAAWQVGTGIGLIIVHEYPMAWAVLIMGGAVMIIRQWHLGFDRYAERRVAKLIEEARARRDEFN